MSLMNAFIEYHIVDITFVNTILSSKLSATPLEAFKGGYFFYRDYLWRVLIIFPFSGSIKIFTVKENHSVQRLARYFATDRQTHRKTADLLLLLQRWRPKKLSCLDYEERYNYWYVLKKLHFPPFEIFIRWPTKKVYFFQFSSSFSIFIGKNTFEASFRLG